MAGEHAEIVRRFGGATVLGKLLGKPTSTVQRWIDEDRIPAQHHDRLFSIAETSGLSLHPSHFFAEKWNDGTTQWQRERSSRTRGQR